MDPAQQRLITLCKLWGAVKYFHPYLAYRDIDWDAALIAAIPRVKAAGDANGFADAVGDMLAALGDPATRIVKPEAPAKQRTDGPEPSIDLGGEGVLYVDLTDQRAFTTYDAALSHLNAVEAKLPDAKAVVFDLRVKVPCAEEWISYLLNVAIPQFLCTEPVVAPGERTRQHCGFPAQGAGSRGYHSAFVTKDGRRHSEWANARRIPAVFIVGQDSDLPDPALALQDAGVAAIVAEEGWNDSGIVSCHSFDLEGGIKARIRLGELLRADGSAGVAANVVVPAPAEGAADAALRAAIALALDFAPPPPKLERPPAIGTPRTEADYAAMTYPSAEHRLLALFRIHNVIDYFFPYKDLMGEDWDAVLAAFIPRFEAAADALDYNLAIAEILTHTHDGHVGARGPVLRDYIGVAAPAVKLRWIEGAAVVAQMADAEVAGLAIGDVVLSVDGEPVEARMARLGRYVTASTPQDHARSVVAQLLRGPKDSEAVLTLRCADGDKRQVRLARSRPAETRIAPPRDGEVVRWLPGGIGYADLDRLERTEVDAMFEKFAAAKAIIFDMRGYPNGTGGLIAARLGALSQPPAARFERPRIFAPQSINGDTAWQVGRDIFIQSPPLADGPRYAGVTVMLIDERAVSQSEHTGLHLRAANGTVLIGSPTAGLNGDITSFVLPGGIMVTFTGQAVLHPDGGQLQRVGLLPDVEVYPTIQGLREGRDEVLQAAIDYIERRLAEAGG